MVEEPKIAHKREIAKSSDIALIIPTFNQYEITKKTIELLKKQSIAFDIVVVDNASDDDTFSRLQQDFADVTLLLAQKNYGGAGGLYLGQKYAYDKGYTYIILSDNDAIPIDEDLIETIVAVCDENSVAQIINEAEDNTPQIRLFHFLCLHRNTIQKIGLIDYKYFIYGDEVEYGLRLEKNKVRFVPTNKAYSHPLKYHFSPNRAYFEVRNELENAKRYPSRRKHMYEFLLTRIVFYKLFEPTKYKVLKEAIKDWFAHRWDNSYIQKPFDADVCYERKSAEKFAAMLSGKRVVVTHNKRIEKLLQNFPELEYSWYSRKKLFNRDRAVLLQNSYIKATLLYDEVYYFVDFDEKGDVIFFRLPKRSFLQKFPKALSAFFIYLLIVARFYYVTR